MYLRYYLLALLSYQGVLFNYLKWFVTVKRTMLHATQNTLDRLQC